MDPKTFGVVGMPDIAKIPGPQSSQCLQEFVFVSDPAGSSPKEPPRGKYGRVDKAVRAESKAVKAVGACWECKYLRKKVSHPYRRFCSVEKACSDLRECTGNPNSPCDTCLKGENDSTWR